MNRVMCFAAQEINVKIKGVLKDQLDKILFVDLPELKNVLEPLKFHVDMGIHLGPKSIFIEPTIVDEIQARFGALNINSTQIKVGNPVKSKYPEDILYNCIAVGRHFFYHRSTEPQIVREYLQEGYQLHQMKQGYVKCSTLVLGDDSVITDDVGLEKAYRDAGLQVLLVSKGSVKLNGFEYGFIGGTSGVLDQMVIFNGDLRTHSDASAIMNFIESRGFKCLCLDEETLEDCGSILILK